MEVKVGDGTGSRGTLRWGRKGGSMIAVIKVLVMMAKVCALFLNISKTHTLLTQGVGVHPGGVHVREYREVTTCGGISSMPIMLSMVGARSTCMTGRVTVWLAETPGPVCYA